MVIVTDHVIFKRWASVMSKLNTSSRVIIRVRNNLTDRFNRTYPMLFTHWTRRKHMLKFLGEGP